MTRQQALTLIRASVAESGEVGQSAIRAYVEHRISRATFNTVCREGMAVYHRNLAATLAAENAAHPFWSARIPAGDAQ